MNQKSKIKNQKSKRGFTLIELLVVILVIFSVGAIISAILFSAFRGANKTNTIDIVRRNGDYAISQMTKMMRYAKSFNGVSTLANPGNLITNCIPSPTPTPLQYSYVTITSFDNGRTTFSCIPAGSPGYPNGQIASNSSLLVDTNNSVSVISCTITCSQDSIASPVTIGINFSLSAITTSGFFEKQASIPFQTSVTFRNY